MVPDTHSVVRLFNCGAMFQISGLQDVRNPIKDTPIHHLQVGSLGDRWFLTHILEIDYIMVVPSFKSQVSMVSGTQSKTPQPPSPGWIFGLQVVPDAHSGDRLSHCGALFQISGLQDVRNPIKDTISRLDLWVTGGS